MFLEFLSTTVQGLALAQSNSVLTPGFPTSRSLFLRFQSFRPSFGARRLPELLLSSVQIWGCRSVLSWLRVTANSNNAVTGQGDDVAAARLLRSGNPREHRRIQVLQLLCCTGKPRQYGAIPGALAGCVTYGRCAVRPPSRVKDCPV